MCRTQSAAKSTDGSSEGKGVRLTERQQLALALQVRARHVRAPSAEPLRTPSPRRGPVIATRCPARAPRIRRGDS